jgi:hypothetical protein
LNCKKSKMLQQQQQASPFRVPSIPASSLIMKSPPNGRKHCHSHTPPGNSSIHLPAAVAVVDDDENKENRPELFQPSAEQLKQQQLSLAGISYSATLKSQQPHPMGANYIDPTSSNYRHKHRMRRLRAAAPAQPLAEISVQALDRLPEHSGFVFSLIATSVTRETVEKLAGKWLNRDELTEISENWDKVLQDLLAAKGSLLAASAEDPLLSISSALSQNNAETKGESAVSLYDLVVNYQQLEFERRAAKLSDTDLGKQGGAQQRLPKQSSQGLEFEIYFDDNEAGVANSAGSVPVAEDLPEQAIVAGWKSPRRSRQQQQRQQKTPEAAAPPVATKKPAPAAATADETLMSPRRAKRKRAPNNTVVAELESLVENGMAIFSPPRPTRSASKSAAATDATSDSQTAPRRQTRSTRRLFTS